MSDYLSDGEIVRVRPIQARKGLFSRKPKLQLDALGSADNCHIYIATRDLSGNPEYSRVVRKDDAVPADSGRLFYIQMGDYPIGITFSDVHRDNNGHSWTLEISGRVSISDSRRLLTSLAEGVVTEHTPLTASLLETWFTRNGRQNVEVFVTKEAGVGPAASGAGNHRRWESLLNEWVGDFGLYCSLHSANWVSAEAEMAEAEAAKEKELERMVEASKRSSELSLKEEKAKAEYHIARHDLETRVELSDRERTHQLTVLEKKHRTEMIEAEAKVAEAQREAERAAIEHEVIVARMRRDSEAEEVLAGKLDEVDGQFQSLTEEIEAVKATLRKISEAPENLLARLGDADPRRAFQAAEQIASPVFGISVDHLASLGYPVLKQQIIGILRNQEVNGPTRVTIAKPDLVSRDIGTTRIMGLPVNTPLQFSIKTSRSGFLTILNIGTSGRIYLHVPNAFVPQRESRCEADRTYLIPGDTFLPPRRLADLGLAYVEAGPPGWEHLAAVVSDSPLFDDVLLSKATETSPFAEIPSDALSSLMDVLSSLDPSQWSAGVLSFLVE